MWVTEADVIAAPATQRRDNKDDGNQEGTIPATAPAAPQVSPFQQPSNLSAPMELLQPEGKGTRIMDQLTQAAALNAKERLQRHIDNAQHNPTNQVAAKVVPVKKLLHGCTCFHTA